MKIELITKIRNKIKHFIRYRKDKMYKARMDWTETANQNKLYEFSSEDIELYLIERNAVLKMQKKIKFDNELSLIQIDNRSIFWNSDISNDDLPWLYHEIFDPFLENPSSYDHPKMNYKNAEWVIDAGCCEGYFSLFAFEKNKQCKVIAFEPLLELNRCLNKTFELELSQNQFVLVNGAISDKAKTIEFQCDDQHICDSSAVLKAQDNDMNHQNIYQVQACSLDDIMKQFSLLEGGIVKMDIEGAEMDALTGAKDLLKQFKPKLAIAVYHDYENALRCKDIILKYNSEYNIEFRGMYGYFSPPRPYILFAW